VKSRAAIAPVPGGYFYDSLVSKFIHKKILPQTGGKFKGGKNRAVQYLQLLDNFRLKYNHNEAPVRPHGRNGLLFMFCPCWSVSVRGKN
jgi:hypothetical protein